MGNIDREKRFEAMPDNAPPKWVFRNITAIRENTDRIWSFWSPAVQGLPRSRHLITEVGFEIPATGAGTTRPPTWGFVVELQDDQPVIPEPNLPRALPVSQTIVRGPSSERKTAARSSAVIRQVEMDLGRPSDRGRRPGAMERPHR